MPLIDAARAATAAEVGSDALDLLIAKALGAAPADAEPTGERDPETGMVAWRRPAYRDAIAASRAAEDPQERRRLRHAADELEDALGDAWACSRIYAHALRIVPDDRSPGAGWRILLERGPGPRTFWRCTLRLSGSDASFEGHGDHRDVEGAFALTQAAIQAHAWLATCEKVA